MRDKSTLGLEVLFHKLSGILPINEKINAERRKQFDEAFRKKVISADNYKQKIEELSRITLNKNQIKTLVNYLTNLL